MGIELDMRVCLRGVPMPACRAIPFEQLTKVTRESWGKNKAVSREWSSEKGSPQSLIDSCIFLNVKKP